MDKRDRHLHRHMARRIALARALPCGRRRQWALRCLEAATNQRRSAYYLLARMWLTSLSEGVGPREDK